MGSDTEVRLALTWSAPGQTVWDNFAAESAEAPIQAKKCQQELIADTEGSVRDYTDRWSVSVFKARPYIY